MPWGQVFAGSLPHAALVAAGFVCLAFSPKHERAAAFSAAALFAAVWLAYLSTWTDQSMTHAISALAGTNIEYEAVWSFTDALTAMVVMAMWGERWWALALWLTLTIQCSGHVASQFGLAPWGPYRALLDGIFTIQWAIFILIGGPGLVDHIFHLLRRCRDFLSPSRTALQQAS